MRRSPRVTSRLHQLQSLRFVAAALVLFGHVLMEARQHGARIADALYGLPWSSGVDIFFVISGFIIFHITRGTAPSGRAATDFAARRIIRLVPLYWGFTLLMAGVVLVAPGHVRIGGLSPGTLLRSLLFIPYRDSSLGVMHPLLGQGWTLNFECLFYAVFAVALLLTRHRFLGVAAVLSALLLAAALVPLPPALRFYADYHLGLFVIGMAMSRWYQRVPRHPGWVVALLLVAALVIGRWLPLDLQLGWFPRRATMASLVVYAALFWRRPPQPAVRGVVPLLGDASYALYLAHPFVVNAVLLAFGLLHVAIGLPFVVVASCAALLFAVLLHLGIERPLLALLTRLYERSIVGRWAKAGRPGGEPSSMLRAEFKGAA